MLQGHPINTSFPSQDIALQMSSKTYINDKKKKKILFKYTIFVIVGKVRVYIFNMAGQ